MLLLDATRIRSAAQTLGVRTECVRSGGTRGDEITWAIDPAGPIREGEILLNGWDEHDPQAAIHESLWIALDPMAAFAGDDGYSRYARASYEERGLFWHFCKTARKPYDLVVAAILLRASVVMPTFSVSSDGSWDEPIWQAARHLYGEVFGELGQKPHGMG